MYVYYLIQLLIYSIAILIISRITGLIYVKNFGTAILFSIVLGIVNTLIKPIFVFISLPITIVTFGIFLIFINGFMLMIASVFFRQVEVRGCFSAAIASVLISFLVYLFSRIIFGNVFHY
ncbi:MAG: phage holin family protein [Candidatus Cloacimonetes bacterium]|nr:phage holin family protein [Candidatus Cloacimonadota bacterium]MBS3766640.1 phage holin family protein [Candidatus Cloacimonadota bacterium]